MGNPRFSVVIPLHNKRPHIQGALDSVRAQTLAPLEIIVVDDCSTDGGREVVARQSDPRIRLFDRAAPGPGGYAARNLAIREARGEWIAFLDADDIWQPDHLAALADAIGEDARVGAAATRFDHVFATRRQPQRIAARLRDGAVVDFRGFLEAWLEVRECPLWTGAIAFRRSVLMTAGLFPEGSAVRGGDKDLWLRAMRLTHLAYSPRNTADFHREAVNKVSNATNTLRAPCLVTTARAMMAPVSPAERKLLRRLINQEIAHYARYAMKAPGRIGIRPGEIALPEGMGTLVLLLAARWVPASLRRSGYGIAAWARSRRHAAAAVR